MPERRVLSTTVTEAFWLTLGMVRVVVGGSALGLPAESLSATGYWKLRRTDEEWRAEKREWIAQAEADLAGEPAAS